LVRAAFRITEVDPSSPESISLQWEMRHELDRMYDVTTIDPPPLEQFRTPRALFLVAWLGDEAIGCGAITTLDDSTAEIKRVFVTHRMRRKGLAKLIMWYLEERAAELGYSTIFLETGDRQPEAIRLYESLGYRRVPCDGRVSCMDWSVCFEKRL
jgi:putative acetyltransferase